MPGRSFSGEGYRYGFNGKEKDEDGEWGQTHYDYGFRIYNPGIGKFLSVDPLTKSYPMLTPYQFASNTPIQAIDLDGLEMLDYRANYKLNYIYVPATSIIFYAEVVEEMEWFKINQFTMNTRIIKSDPVPGFKPLITETELNNRWQLRAGPSIWNDPRIDASPADVTPEKFKIFNNNHQPSNMSALAHIISEGSKYTYNNILNGKKNLTLKEMNLQLSALRLSLDLVESSINNTDQEILVKNYDYFIVTEDRFKIDLTNFVFDGSLPQGEEYQLFIKSQGERILNHYYQNNNEIAKTRITD